MSGRSSEQRSARQSVISCSEPNCTARTADTLALSAASAWTDTGSAVDVYRLVELQLPASAAPTVSDFQLYSV